MGYRQRGSRVVEMQHVGSPKRSLNILQKEQGLKQRNKTSVREDAETFDGDWVDDKAVTACTLCACKFTLINRRHHCRSCGTIICSKCSTNRLVFEGILKRACDKCYQDEIATGRSELGFQQSRAQTSSGHETMQAAASRGGGGGGGSGCGGGGVTVLPVPSSSSASAQPNFPSWIEALLIVRQDVNVGDDGGVTTDPHILSCVPSDQLNGEELKDITAHAMPATSRKELNFMFRVRNKAHDAKNLVASIPELGMRGFDLGSDFLNCYTCFQQRKVPGSTSQYSRIAIVLVSYWPYSTLAFRVLSKLSEAMQYTLYQDQGDARQNSQDGGAITGAPSSSSEAEVAAAQLINASFAEVDEWPTPVLAKTIDLSYLGDELAYRVSDKIARLPSSTLCLQLSKAYDAVNLVSYFGRLGLLTNLWLLWELVLTGQNIVVVGRHARECSEFVVALTSLVEPYVYSGDVRPYVCRQESDADALAKMAKNRFRDDEREQSAHAKNASDSHGSIVGVAEIDMLDSFEYYDACVLLTGYSGVTEDNFTKVIFDKKVPITVMGTTEKYRPKVHAWKARGQSAPVTVLVRHEPSVESDVKLLERIRKMDVHDCVVLGNTLIRHHLEHLNKEYFRPILPMRQLELSIAASKLETTKGVRIRAVSTLRQDNGALADTILFIVNLPQWIPYNMPTVIMYLLVVLVVGIYYASDMPVVPLVVFLYFVHVPERAPVELEDLFGLVLPASLLHPRGRGVFSGVGMSSSTRSKSIEGRDGDELVPRNPTSSATTSTAAAGGESLQAPSVNGEAEETGQPDDLSGVWKRVSTDNYDAFLAAQGVNYLKRRVALGLKMVHTITLDGPPPCRHFRLQENGGPVSTDTTYVMDAEPVKTTYVSAHFMDKCWWKGKKLMINKRDVDNRYELVVGRWLSEEGRVMEQSALYRNLKDGTEVMASVRFELQGPSPHAPPRGDSSGTGVDDGRAASSPKAASAASTTTGTASLASASATAAVDLSGVWKRLKCDNMEAFTGVQGAGYLKRKLAASMALTHTITMDKKGESVVRVQEQGGPLNLDCTMDVGADVGVMSSIQGKKFLQRAYWKDGKLVVYRTAESGDCALEMVRELEKSSQENAKATLVLSATHIPLDGAGKETGHRTTATSWFEFSANSPGPVPARATTSEAVDDEEEEQQQEESGVNMSGTWLRATTKNFDKFVAAQGAGYLAQKLAASMNLKHTLMVSADKKTLHLEEKGGQLDTKRDYVIGGPATEGEMLGKMYKETVDWQGEALVLTRRHVKGDFELVLTRFLARADDGTPTIRLQSVHKDLSTGTETESSSIFCKAP
jgi:hypothetical protein